MHSEEFISKAKQVVLDNLQNAQFGVSILAKELGMSRSELYRRIKKSRSSSVSRFIREIRLEEAAKLLRTKNYSIGEIAYMVGFNSPTYFSTCYKEYYGCPPSEPIVEPVQKEYYIANKSRKWLIPLNIGAVIVMASFWILSVNKEHKTNDEKSLAVLKFDHLGTDSTNSFLANAVADEIINNLSNLGTLKVITASSSFKVDKNNGIDEIGKKLGVSYVIDGSLWCDKNRLKATVKLIDITTGYQLWSEAFEEQFDDFFDVQGHIAERVAQHLKISLARNLESPESRKRTLSFKAFELYVRAMQLGEIRKDESIDEAIKLLETAVSLDPNFAEAYSELSFLYGQKHYYGTLSREDRDKLMRINILKAFELSPESPEVLFAMADYEYKIGDLDKDSSKIIDGFRKVLKIKPNDARSNYRLYQLFGKIRQNELSHRHLENAVDLDPLNPFYKTILARDYFWDKGEYKKGIALIEEALKDDPRHVGARYFNAIMQADKPHGSLISAYKFLHKALIENPYEFGYLYWGSLLATDLDLLPIAKGYVELIKLRFPDNPLYTYEPTLHLHLIEKRYEDAFALTEIWSRDKDLNKEVVATRMARIYYLQGEFHKAKEILLGEFSDLFEVIDKGLLNVRDFKTLHITPVRTYIEILREEGNESQALKYADYLCAHFKIHKYYDSGLPTINHKKFQRMECFYLQNNIEAFLDEVHEIYFENRNRFGLFGSLKSSKFHAFESKPEFRELFNEIKRETHMARSEVIEYLKNQGDWKESWNTELTEIKVTN